MGYKCLYRVELCRSVNGEDESITRSNFQDETLRLSNNLLAQWLHATTFRPAARKSLVESREKAVGGSFGLPGIRWCNLAHNMLQLLSLNSQALHSMLVPY